MRNAHSAQPQWVLPILILGLAWGAVQPLAASEEKQPFWKKAIAAVTPGKEDKTQPKAVLKEMIGTWVGKQDDMPQVQITLVLRQNKTFEFSTRLAPEALKKMPKGSANQAMNSQKGTYSFEGNVLKMEDNSEVGGMSKKWKLVDKVLILDNEIKLKKTK